MNVWEEGDRGEGVRSVNEGVKRVVRIWRVRRGCGG